MSSVMINANEFFMQAMGDYCKKLHNPLTRVMYHFAMSVPSYPYELSKEAFYCVYDLQCVTVI